MPQDAKSLDPEVLESLRELAGPDDPNFFADLVAQFIAHADGAIVDLRAAVAAADAKRLESVAHSLKGSSGNMGAKGMQATCGELQRAGREATVERAAPLVEALAAEYATVRARLAEAAGRKE